MTPRIHPTAQIDPKAELADDVEVGPFAIIEGLVRVDTGCKIRAHAQLIGPLTLGPDNSVGRNAILGEEPQHLTISGTGADLVIGTGNVFRENVTVHRGCGPGKVTRIGNRNFFMGGSHIAHDCLIGDKCILANNALVAGHCVLYDGVYLSGNSAVHQRTYVGRLAMLAGVSAVSKDVPPFTIMQSFNQVMGVNVIGMRRAEYPTEEIDAVRRAYRILYLQGHVVPVALDKIERDLRGSTAVAELVDFVRRSPNGINLTVAPRHRKAA